MLAPILALCLSLCASEGLGYWYGQPSAALWKDQLFVAITSQKAQGLLYRGTFTPGARRIRSPLEYDNPSTYTCDEISTQAKVHIQGDRILLYSGSFTYYLFQFEHLPLLESSTFGDKLRDLPAGPFPPADPALAPVLRSARYEALIRPCAAQFEHLLFPRHRKADIPLAENEKTGGDSQTPQTYLRHARFDVLIAGKKSVWLFHVYKDKIFISVEPDCLSDWYLDANGKVAKDLPEPPQRQLRTGKLPGDFTERFAAYASGGSGYLVTPSGKVYMAAPKGKAELEVSAVWSDPRRKIVGVVQDQAGDAAYGWGFVTTSAAPERFYVRLGPKPAAVGYKLTVPLWADRSDAYLESYECARAFRKANHKK